MNKWLKDDWIREEVVSAKKLSLEKEYEQQKDVGCGRNEILFKWCQQ